MGNYITIDTGTTNTRISVVINGKIVDTIKYKIGVGDVKNDKNILKNTIKKGIAEILKQNNFIESDIECVIACGMITSELGLCNLEHIAVPCGIKDIANGLHNAKIPEICELPFVFVRGVKAVGDSFADTDVMRGEETEIFGLSENIEPESLYVLPGSHSKLIKTDNMGRISSFSTELTGELMSAVASSTILSQSIDLSVDVDVDKEYLKKGYLYAKEKGVSAAFFKVRILNNIFGCSKPQLYGFFKGAALCSEIENIIKSGAAKVIIAGKSQLREPMVYLLNELSQKEIISISDYISNNATTFGMVKIYEYPKKENNNGKAL